MNRLKLTLLTIAAGITMLSPRFATETDILAPQEVVDMVDTSEAPTEKPTSTDLPELPTLGNRYYPATGIVIGIEKETDSVIYADFSGNYWDFKGIDDWMKGDRVALIMDNMGTPDSIYDDEPVVVRYCGWVY